MHLFLKTIFSPSWVRHVRGGSSCLFGGGGGGGGAFMETQSAESSHQRCKDSGEEVRPVLPASAIQVV